MTAAVAVRVAAAFALGDKVIDLPGTFDQISYHNLAVRVLTGHGFSFGEAWWPATQAGAPTAHWSFLYTFFLVAAYALFGIHPLVPRLIQAIITGLLQPYLAYCIGNNLFSKSVGLVAAGLTAFYAYFVYYAATLMTEPFFITLVMAGLYLAVLVAQSSTEVRRASSCRHIILLTIMSGFSLGSAVLLRQLILLFVPVIFLWLWWALHKQDVKLILLYFATTTCIIAAMVLPFTAYNSARFGHIVLLNTNSGYAFFWANHPIYGTRFQGILTSATYQDLIPPELRSLDEAALDQALLQRGFQFIVDDPVRYLWLSVSRIPVFFQFWPSSSSSLISNFSRVVSFGVLWPFMLYGFIRSAVAVKTPIRDYLASPVGLLQLFVVAYTSIHLLSWALIRYRLPVDAVLLIFASSGGVELVRRLAPWPRAALGVERFRI